MDQERSVKYRGAPGVARRPASVARRHAAPSAATDPPATWTIEGASAGPNAATRIALSGRWTAEEAATLRSVLDVALALPVPLVVLDLSDVRGVDEHAHSCLTAARERARQLERRFVLVGPSPRRRLFGSLVDGDGSADGSGSDGARTLGDPDVLRLTPRQHEILRLLDEGLSSKDIARRLWLSPATVRNHVAAVLAALGAHSRLQALRRAREAGLLP